MCAQVFLSLLSLLENLSLATVVPSLQFRCRLPCRQWNDSKVVHLLCGLVGWNAGRNTGGWTGGHACWRGRRNAGWLAGNGTTAVENVVTEPSLATVESLVVSEAKASRARSSTLVAPSPGFIGTFALELDLQLLLPFETGGLDETFLSFLTRIRDRKVHVFTFFVLGKCHQRQEEEKSEDLHGEFASELVLEGQESNRRKL